MLLFTRFGIISLTINHLTNTSSFNNVSMVYALLAIAFVGYFVWAHHMFITGMTDDARIYFSSATAIIGVPTAIKILHG
jgi:cytochrome c oxidase subunit 1